MSEYSRVEYAGARILVVDDEPDVVAVLAETLRGFGYEPTTATSSDEALALVRGAGFDLILADLYMPRMNGLTLFNELKLDVRTRGIPFVIFTGKEAPGDRWYAKGVGVGSFLNKPIDPTMLRLCVEAVLQSTPNTGWAQTLSIRMTAEEVKLALPAMSQAEAFVLSRLAAGGMPIEDLLPLCALPEEEVRLIVDRLIKSGVLGLGPSS